MKKSILVFCLTLVIMVLALFGLSQALHSTAQANAQKAHLEKMRTLLPGSREFTVEAYTGEDVNIQKIHKGETGYVIETATDGYAGPIRMLVGVSNQGQVTGLMILDMEETAGLGGKALTDWKFLSQFLNTAGDAKVGETVDAISGATVTSKAIARCVNSAVGFVTGADADSGATSWGG